LFSESHSRLVVEVALENQAAFEKAMAEYACARIGTVTADRTLRVRGLDGRQVVDIGVDQLRATWQGLNVEAS